MADFANGFEPSIAMGVTGAGAAPAQLNPLEAIGTLANARNALNQNQLFQQTQAARYKLGRIMATAPSTEAGLSTAMQDPQIAGFVPDLLQSLQGSQTQALGREATTQTMGIEGMGAIEKGLAGAVDNPSLFNPIVDATRSTLAPVTQPQVAKGVDFLRKALNGDPANYTKNLAAISIGAGTNPDTIRNLLGEPSVSTAISPVGPGGASVPVQVGAGVGETPTAKIMGQGESGVGAGAGAGPASGPVGPITGQTPQQVAIQTAEGATAGNVEQDMNDAAQTLFPAMHRLNTVYNTMSHFLTGGGADTMANLAKGLQAVRDRVPGFESLIPQSTIDKVSGGSLGDAQLFKETIIPTMAAVLRASSTKQTANEINSYISSFDTDTDPRALLGGFNQMRFTLQNQAYALKSYNEFKQKINSGDPSVAGQSMDNFYPWFAVNKFDLKTGQPLDKDLFQEFDPGPVLGVGDQGEAAGDQPKAGGPTPPTGSNKDKMKSIFGF